MTEHKNMTKEELIEWLDNAIEIETKKPTNEIDMDFVTECEQLINVLMGNYHEYTDEDAERYLAEIEKREKAKKNTFFIRSKKALAASVAVFIIFLGGFAVYASSPVVREFIHNVLNLDMGQGLEQDGITYVFLGQSFRYKNIETLLESENLNIKYPTNIPYNAYIKKVRYIETEENIYFTFSDERIQFTISKNKELSIGLIQNAETVTIDNLIFYINSKNNCFIAYSIINSDLYTLQCDSKEELIKMIKSIE